MQLFLSASTSHKPYLRVVKEATGVINCGCKCLDTLTSVSFKIMLFFSHVKFCEWIDVLEQDCSISSALAMEILQSCTKPSKQCLLSGENIRILLFERQPYTSLDKCGCVTAVDLHTNCSAVQCHYDTDQFFPYPRNRHTIGRCCVLFITS